MSFPCKTVLARVRAETSHGESHDDSSKANDDLTSICINVKCIDNAGDISNQRICEDHSLIMKCRVRIGARRGTTNLTFDPGPLRAKLTLLISPLEEATTNADFFVGCHLSFRTPPPPVCTVKVCFHPFVREIL